MRQEWVLGLTERDLADGNVLSRRTSIPVEMNPCKRHLWDVFVIVFFLEP